MKISTIIIGLFLVLILIVSGCQSQVKTEEVRCCWLHISNNPVGPESLGLHVYHHADHSIQHV